MENLPVFDEIYVVSDIHMGGRPGFQVFKHAERLGRLIEHLGTVRSDGTVGLVLNGDVIDSLAEDLKGYVATEDAGEMMKRIYENFSPVWEGLASFIRQPSRRLVFVTGNHDIELALPGVEQSIRQHIAGDDPALSGVITFATRGAGYACRVGSARVFCTHGNEVDNWNVVNYDKLGQLGNALNAGRDIELGKWEPNAGTRLVVDLMNKVKKNYPFVDLLKPETKIVVPILLVLEPGLARHIDAKSVFGIAWDKLKGNFVTSGLLGAATESDNAIRDPRAAADVALKELLGGELREFVGTAQSVESAEDMLLEAETVMRGGEVPKLSQKGDETLGWFGMAVDRLRGVNKSDALRKALLDWLEGDDTFDTNKRDDTFDLIVKRVASNVDFVVTGHTHLERALPIDVDGDRFYYNCGTWIRLIQFTQKLLDNKEAFARVMAVLKGGSMNDLDTAMVGDDPLVLDRTATVRIAKEADTVVGQLLRVGDGPQGSVTLKLIPDTEFRK